MHYDYSKLKGRIREMFGTNRAFAAAINRSERTVSLKLNNLLPWSQKEIDDTCIALCIPYAEIDTYFFAKKVQRG